MTFREEHGGGYATTAEQYADDLFAESDYVGYFGDWMATAAELAGGKMPDGCDSISFAPALLGRPAEQQKHEFIYWEFHERGFKEAALYQGRWKGIRNGGPDAPVELYDMQMDVAEKNECCSGASRYRRGNRRIPGDCPQ